MAQTIKLKRSSTPGNVPTAEQMETGELAMNTADGKLYMKDNSLVRSIVTLGVDPLSPPKINGSVHIVGDFTLDGSFTANEYIISSSVMHMTASFRSGSTISGDTIDDTHQFTGSLFVSGGLTLEDSINFNRWNPRRDLGTTYAQWAGNNTDPLFEINLGNGLNAFKASSGSQAGNNVVINDDQENYNFIVRGVNEEFLLKTDSSTDSVGINIETPTSTLHVNGVISGSSISSSKDIEAADNIISKGVFTGFISSSADTLEVYSDRIKINAYNTSGDSIIVSHSLSDVSLSRPAIVYTNAGDSTPGPVYNNEFYTFADTGSDGFFKGGGHCQLSASIGAVPQRIAQFDHNLNTLHIEYSAVSKTGGYTELGDFYIGRNALNRIQSNQSPKILMGKGTNTPILELSASFTEKINFLANVKASYEPVEIVYSFTNYRHSLT